jgi:hypothetical protein
MRLGSAYPRPAWDQALAAWNQARAATDRPWAHYIPNVGIYLSPPGTTTGPAPRMTLVITDPDRPTIITRDWDLEPDLAARLGELTAGWGPELTGNGLRLAPIGAASPARLASLAATRLGLNITAPIDPGWDTEIGLEYQLPARTRGYDATAASPSPTPGPRQPPAAPADPASGEPPRWSEPGWRTYAPEPR